MCSHLFGDAARLLYSGKLWREDNDGHHDSQLSQHLLTAGRRDQPSHVARNAAHRQVPVVHDGSRHLFYNRDGLRVEYSFSVTVDTYYGAVGAGALSECPSSTAVHAATTRSIPAAGQVPEGQFCVHFMLLCFSFSTPYAAFLYSIQDGA